MNSLRLRIKLILIILSTFTVNVFFAQDLPIDSETGKITFSEVVYVDSTITKDQLYYAAREWFAKVFKNSKDVLEIDDIQSGKLIGNGNFTISTTEYLTDSRVDFSISIYIKDGRYKFVFSNFNHVSFKSGYSGGALEDEKPDCGNLFMMKAGWIDVKEQTKTNVSNLISDLKKSMVDLTKGEDKDDW